MLSFVSIPAQVFVDLCYLHLACAIYFLVFILYKGCVDNNYLHHIFIGYNKIKKYVSKAFNSFNLKINPK